MASVVQNEITLNTTSLHSRHRSCDTTSPGSTLSCTFGSAQGHSELAQGGGPRQRTVLSRTIPIRVARLGTSKFLAPSDGTFSGLSGQVINGLFGGRSAPHKHRTVSQRMSSPNVATLGRKANIGHVALALRCRCGTHHLHDLRLLSKRALASCDLMWASF